MARRPGGKPTAAAPPAGRGPPGRPGPLVIAAVSATPNSRRCGAPGRWDETPMNPEWRSRYEAALEVTGRAARRALGYFDAAVAVEWKHDHSPVTVADRETEQELRTSLRRLFPADGLLG